MNALQRIVYVLARMVGLLPPMPAGLVDQAKRLVREVEATNKLETNEYRRHLVFKRLTDGGASSRAAAVAIEIAVNKELR